VGLPGEKKIERIMELASKTWELLIISREYQLY
jgi:hypothetical protein